VEALFGGAGGIAQKAMFGVQKLIHAPMVGISSMERAGGNTPRYDVTGYLFDSTF